MFALCLLTLLGSASATLLRGPEDHLIHEAVEHANHSADAKPETALEKDFIALDRNGDKTLDMDELTFRQYASGCDPMEAQIRAQDYMRCGDANKNGNICVHEFEAAAKPEWAECVRASSDRRAHTFYRFFEADDDFNGKLSEIELRTEVVRMWGEAGNALVQPLMTCTDTNKDHQIDQSEFHKSLAAYNPSTGKWQMLYHDGDEAVLTCLDAAMKEFDTELAFHATDANKDNKISKSESYDTMGKFNPSMDHAKADKLFEDADANKDGFLDLDEFKAAGANHKPAAAASFLLHGAITVAPGFDEKHEQMYGGMGAVCAARKQETYSLWSEKKAQKDKKAVLAQQDPCAGCSDTALTSHQKCAVSMSHNPCSTQYTGVAFDNSCCIAKEKHGRCLGCKSSGDRPHYGSHWTDQATSGVTVNDR